MKYEFDHDQPPESDHWTICARIDHIISEKQAWFVVFLLIGKRLLAVLLMQKPPL